MAPLESELIDWTVCSATRSALGENFVRILGYFREDGIASVSKIEAAMRANDPFQMVLAAHKLKGEALQFGALKLTITAETIEMIARACVEHHETPDEVIELAVALRPMFEETLAILEKDASPVVQQRHPLGFGRRFG
ncbi:Hpt domain-containing protein [Parasphingorhabdus sp.]|jgi:HPt (histidine-containing phosphotransfer) domain-containing protein|uniref:Hpt domain-containing protein n=1 Tax=Parasphingorhabdus sp. TaxID=2709688 RepID=UPI0030B1F6A5|nr:Hpt domain-containing protein [Sphingomonadales bacterium]